MFSSQISQRCAGSLVPEILEQIKADFGQLTQEVVVCKAQRDEFHRSCRALQPHGSYASVIMHVVWEL
jgi:hypothetical protein